MAKEIFKDVKGYEGSYQISNFGRVKSLERIINRRGHNHRVKERILKKNPCHGGYLLVYLSLHGKVKSKKVHQLVCESFLGHVPDGTQRLTCNHINHIVTDNRLANLEIVTNRENCNQKHIKGFSSKYTGVSWSKQRRKWLSFIYLKDKNYNLGGYDSEIEASNVYQMVLDRLKRKGL